MTTIITTADGERVSKQILYENDEVLGVLITDITDIRGKIFASRTRESFAQQFGVFQDRDREYSATLAVAMLTLSNELKHIFQETQAIITLHKHCKTILIPVASHGILVGLVTRRSAHAEDFKIADNIEGLFQSGFCP